MESCIESSVPILSVLCLPRHLSLSLCVVLQLLLGFWGERSLARGRFPGYNRSLHSFEPGFVPLKRDCTNPSHIYICRYIYMHLHMGMSVYKPHTWRGKQVLCCLKEDQGERNVCLARGHWGRPIDARWNPKWLSDQASFLPPENWSLHSPLTTTTDDLLTYLIFSPLLQHRLLAFVYRFWILVPFISGVQGVFGYPVCFLDDLLRVLGWIYPQMLSDLILIRSIFESQIMRPIIPSQDPKSLVEFPIYVSRNGCVYMARLCGFSSLPSLYVPISDWLNW